MTEVTKDNTRFLASICVCAFLVVCALQVLYISQTFDAYSLVLENKVGGFATIFGYAGMVAKILVLFVVILGLLLHRKASHYWQALLDRFVLPRMIMFLAAQLVAYLLLYFLSDRVFGESSSPNAFDLSAWLVVALLWTGLSLLVLLKAAAIYTWVLQERVALLIAASVASVVWLLASYTKNLWGPLSDLTFILVILLLDTVFPDRLYADFDGLNIGLDEFIVNIAPACSGYEGIGLVCAFTSIYLYLFKSEFRFPFALLLFPIGALAIWLLNVVRIAVLITIGAYWSPDIAVGGFHSQAGWVTFIVSSLGILWLGKSIPLFSKPSVSDSKGYDVTPRSVQQVSSSGDTDQAIASLIPFVCLMAVILVSNLLSAGFDWWYPLRLLIVGGACLWVWSKLPLGIGVFCESAKRAEVWLAGITVAVLWILLLKADNGFNDTFSASLSSEGTMVAVVWLIARFIGSSLLIPIVEELAFRGYLLCKLSKSDVKLSGKLPISVLAVLVSSLAFGFLHGAWFAGTVAGIVYAVVRLRGRNISDAILAHGITNAVIFAYALVFNAWHLI